MGYLLKRNSIIIDGHSNYRGKLSLKAGHSLRSVATHDRKSGHLVTPYAAAEEWNKNPAAYRSGRLQKKKKDLENKKLLKLFEESPNTFEEVKAFLQGNSDQHEE